MPNVFDHVYLHLRDDGKTITHFVFKQSIIIIFHNHIYLLTKCCTSAHHVINQLREKSVKKYIKLFMIAEAYTAAAVT